MSHLTLDIVVTKATTLGFRCSLLGQGRYRLLKANTSFGYQGNLDGCHAYLQGWEEASRAFPK